MRFFFFSFFLLQRKNGRRKKAPFQDRFALFPCAACGGKYGRLLRNAPCPEEEQRRAVEDAGPYEENAAPGSDWAVAARWVEWLWAQPLRRGVRRYYDNCLYMFALLALFIILMLALLWFFQIALLKPMYESIRRHELSYFAAALARADSDSLQEEADRFARRTNICCTVYEISGQYAMQRASAHILSGCVIHNVSSESMMNRLYAGARANALYTCRRR